MADDLTKTMSIAASGMKVQGTRLRVIAENLANANSTAANPGDLPYRRKVISFKNAFDREMGVNKVQVRKVDVDRSDFVRKYEPGHPSADADGYVMMPNVNPLIETMDMKEAQRSYEANLGVIDTTKQMVARTIDILK
jgi:flagellar basal-body rod protein FlgC